MNTELPVSSLKQNDPAQLHNLVVEHSEGIYRLARSIVRDNSLAEDVTQETLVKAWLAMSSFRGESSLKSWIMKIAYNTSISAIRSRKAIVMDPNDLPEGNSRDDIIERKVQNHIVMSEFEKALDLLDDLSRSIVVLREVEQLSYDEIVNILQVPLPTVKTRLLRARRTLAVALKEWA